MGLLHNQVASVRIPGLPENMCYADHLKIRLAQGRDQCVSGFRLLINAAFPFMYSDIRGYDPDTPPLSPVPLVVQQPKKTN